MCRRRRTGAPRSRCRRRPWRCRRRRAPSSVLVPAICVAVQPGDRLGVELDVLGVELDRRRGRLRRHRGARSPASVVVVSTSTEVFLNVFLSNFGVSLPPSSASIVWIAVAPNAAPAGTMATAGQSAKPTVCFIRMALLLMGCLTTTVRLATCQRVRARTAAESAGVVEPTRVARARPSLANVTVTSGSELRSGTPHKRPTSAGRYPSSGRRPEPRSGRLRLLVSAGAAGVEGRVDQVLGRLRRSRPPRRSPPGARRR